MGNMENSEMMQMSLAEFLFDDETFEMNENDILTKAFCFVMKELSVSDIVEIWDGNFSNFDKLEVPLKEYMNEHLFSPVNTEDKTNAVIEQLFSNFYDLMESLRKNLKMKSNIDYKSTIKNFFCHNIIVLKNALQGPIPDCMEYGEFLCKLCRIIILEFLYVHQISIEDGNESLQTTAVRILNSLCSKETSQNFILTHMFSTLVIDNEFALYVAKRHIVYTSESSSSTTEKKDKENVAESRIYDVKCCLRKLTEDELKSYEKVKDLKVVVRKLNFPDEGAEHAKRIKHTSVIEDHASGSEVSIVDKIVHEKEVERMMCATSVPVSIPTFSHHPCASVFEDADDFIEPLPTDPEQIATSMHALACSVKDGTEMFDELPRPCLNTGESLSPKPL